MTMPDRLGPLLRLVVALKVNKVWPRAACVILYGWKDGQAQWRGDRWPCPRHAGDRCETCDGLGLVSADFMDGWLHAMEAPES